jgi:3-oxoacyl-[acyl-carrier protein] reductase
LLGDAGYRLVLVGRGREALEETCQGTVSPEALLISADLAQPHVPEAVIGDTVAAFGRLDVLVNNAGTIEVMPIDGLSEPMLERVFAVNTFAAMRLIKHAWPVFSQQKSGRVVNVSSWSTIDPFPGISVYAASKAALESMTRSIMNEGAELGIHAYSIQFGSVETDMLRCVVPEAQIGRDQTMDPEDAARVIVDCVEGRRPDDLGRSIPVPSP